MNRTSIMVRCNTLPREFARASVLADRPMNQITQLLFPFLTSRSSTDTDGSCRLPKPHFEKHDQ